MPDNQDLQYGPITVSATGMSRRKTFFFFGQSFDLSWGEITSWSVTDTIFVMTSMKLEEIVSRILKISTHTETHVINWSGSASEFKALVSVIRARVPEKEIQKSAPPDKF